MRLRSAGETLSLNALYAMDAALEERPWLDVGEGRRRELRAAAAFDGDDLTGGPDLATDGPTAPPES